MSDRMMASLNRLAKWRRVLSGKMVGTRPENDPFIVGMNDLMEARLITRAELTALAGLLLRKGIFTEAEFAKAVADEADLLNEDFAKRFPGFTASQDGISMDPQVALKTMQSQPWAK